MARMTRAGFRRPGAVVALIGVLAVAGARAEPEPAPVASVLSRMEQAMAGVKTVKTRFVQEKQMALFTRPLVTRGTIWVEPPAHLLWRVESPMQYALAIQGQRAQQWDGETGKTTTLSLGGSPVMAAVTEQLNAWFGGRYCALARDYEITQQSAAPPAFAFVPKPDAPAAKMLKAVTVTFREDERYIASIRIEDCSGDRTTLTFEETELNVPIAPNEWEL